MLALARASALHALDRACHLLPIARDHGLLHARLAEDMDDFAMQIVFTASFAQRAVLPLVGAPLADLDLDDPDGALSVARAGVMGADGALVDRIAHRAGHAVLDQPPDAYLATFALPNLWFHLSVAYAILRGAGAPVGKADLDGLHRYPKGSSWRD